MNRLALQTRLLAWTVGLSWATLLFGAAAQAQQPVCSAWLIESSRFMKVPFGAFMPDRTFVPGSNKPESSISTVDLPVNVGVIKCGNDLILYDTGWKQQEYLKMTGSEHWAPIGEQLKVLGFNASDVTKVVIGHATGTMPASCPTFRTPCSTCSARSSRRSNGRSITRRPTLGRSIPIRAAAIGRQLAVTCR